MASSQLVALIKTLSPSRICLQFPDDLLHLSPTISASLTQYASVHILGDTTYGSCCVDTIAANHVSPDLLVHYGPACLSKPACVFPVYYEFEHLPIEYAQITGLIGNIEGRVMVFFNTLYNNAMEGVRQQMKQQDQEMYERIIWTEIDTLVNAHTLRDRTGYDSFHGRYFKMPSGGPDAVLYIGKPNLFSAHVAMQYAHCRVEMHDPETGGYATPSGNKMLMRRYALVQRAKDAMTIGIVIGTLGVDSYGDVIKQLRELVIKRGKKPYMLAVGKPSPAKLGNFLDIDVFCLVSCPENALVDSKEFLRPIVTPYELMLALDPNSGWQAEKYELDLAKMASSLEVEMKKDVDCSEGHFSLATGRMMRNVSLADTNDHDHHDTEGVIIERGPHHVSTNVVSSAAAVFLNERTFKGLEPRIGETDAKFAVQGRRGIARNYQA